MHILCTICSDLVNQAENIHATKCGHIFHYHCLSQWIDRSKSCPQCRNKVTDRCMYRIYPTVSNENTGEDITTIHSRLDDALLQLRQQKAASKEKENKLVTINADLKKNEELIKTFEKKLISRDSAVAALKEQLEYVKVQNKETQRLKEENETLKKNMQMLNGLQKVLNATSEEVEEMLQGYADVKMVATFATALKRALCESESKKNELRERLHTAKQSCASEKANVQSLQAKIVKLEDKLAAAERKCEFGINKRKASQDQETEVNDLIRNLQEKYNVLGETPAKQMKPHPKFNDVILSSDPNTSFNTMVKTIENADSPYLSLKQSSLALTALQQRPAHMAPESRLKPSEFALLNSVRNAVTKNQPSKEIQRPSHSIFHTKQLAFLDIPQENHELNTAKLDISYDGLGGHSKLDSFPVPKPQLKSCVPKLTAKHKLKRPSNSQDISKMLGRMKENK